MHARLTRPWLAVALLAYVAAAGAELVRTMAFGRPTSYAMGFHPWETGPGIEDPERLTLFRWSAARATLVVPAAGTVVAIPLYMAKRDIEAAPVGVSVSVDAEMLGAVTIRSNGWLVERYYLPPVLSRGNETDGAARPESIAFGFDVARPFIPASLVTGSDDRRLLGVGVGPFEWSDSVDEKGLGLAPWESEPDGRRFRWTTRTWASLPLRVRGERATVLVRAAHPDIDATPVGLEVYWNERRVQTLRLTSHDWQTLELSAREDLATIQGVLTLHVDRTWNPAADGVSRDDRDLGVAISEIAWQ